MLTNTEHPAAIETPARGRAAQLQPGNRFESRRLEVLDEHRETLGGRPRQVATDVARDQSRTIINHVDSPDIGFRWTVNPYRGCEHGCVYCYARPGHEMLGFSCGLDFETRLMAKVDAPQLIRDELAAPNWSGQAIVMSGVTDCYQPIEREMRITRQILEVFAECRQPVSIVTKSRLILRDLDVLQELASYDAVRVAVSITSFDNSLAAAMEPRAASPGDRIWTIRRLASAGIPVACMVAPIIPAINDREVPTILRRAADAGARSAGYVLLRLPHGVKDLFFDWLERHDPDRRDHVASLLKQMRGGAIYDATFGTRMKGEGPLAEQLHRMFRLFARRCGLDESLTAMSPTHFRRPADRMQLDLFPG